MDAFDGLAPLDDSYAARPVGEAFDWSTVASTLPVGREWYLVAFRSVRRAGCDEARLCDFDERAHHEAEAAPGFVHYFKGPTASDGSCLSFCLWDSRAHAREAAAGPNHRAAVELLHEMYERYTLEFLRVTHPRGSTDLRFEPYDHVAPPPADQPVRSPLASLTPLADPAVS
jgi:hypothetical protein